MVISGHKQICLKNKDETLAERIPCPQAALASWPLCYSIGRPNREFLTKNLCIVADIDRHRRVNQEVFDPHGVLVTPPQLPQFAQERLLILSSLRAMFGPRLDDEHGNLAS